MNATQLTSQNLKKAITLTEQKEAAQAKIAEIDQRLAALCGEAPAEPSVAPVAKVKAGRKMKTGKRVNLTEAIINVLKNAGSEGIRLRDIAKALGRKANNINAWVHSTGQKIKGVKKLRKGVYGWRG